MAFTARSLICRINCEGFSGGTRSRRPILLAFDPRVTFPNRPKNCTIGGGAVRAPHNPKVRRRGDGNWVVECEECKADRLSSLPIEIGIPLSDRVTAERIAENHRGPGIAIR
jgi:hypothetical protein